MNPVHAVLRNWDILQVIIHFMKGDFIWEFGRTKEASLRDLVAVALVCRIFSNLALNILWRDITMEKIYSLFPMDMMRENPGGNKSLTRIPATPQEWERFDVYAFRIRELRASPMPNDLFLHGVRNRHPTLRHPFPNLTCLMWLSDPPDVVDAITLICPTLTEVHLSIEKLNTDVEEDDDTVADILRSIGETCPRLKGFTYKHYSVLTPMTCRSKTVETSLIYLIHLCRHLEDVDIPASRDILCALAALPHLSTLVLDYAMWEDWSQLHLPVHWEADKWIEEADRFPVLDDLAIEGSHTVSSLTECFQGSGCFPKRNFTMCEMSECDQWSTTAIAEFFRGILRSDRREVSLTLDIYREIDVQNPVGHDPWNPLWCLSSIPNLSSLWLEGLFLEINDTDLEEILKTWPELESLHLNVPYADEDYQSHISFQGLAHLSTLKNLKSCVSLMLAPDSTISDSMLLSSISSNSQLTALTIQGKFPPVALYAAAMFLILHFPKLKGIKTSFDSDTGEKERMKEIQGLLDAARPRMGNSRSELLNCRSRTRVDVEQDAD